MADAGAVARRMWTLFEPVHVVTYFSPEARSGFEAAGLRGFWRGYFAGRAAPLGAVAAAPTTGAVFNFAPTMVARAIPGVWELITPEEALAVRSAGAVAALRRLLGSASPVDQPAQPVQPVQPVQPDQPDQVVRPVQAVQTTQAVQAMQPVQAMQAVHAMQAVQAAGGLLAVATAGLDCAGRVLASANAALPEPAEPLARLWQAATLLREHRGDGHSAALVAAGLDGCEALVLRTGLDLTRRMLQPIRGWTDEEWDAAAARLARRGWLGPDGRATPEGAAAHRAVEDATDLAAARPWARLGHAATEQLAGVLSPIALACAAGLPYPNPIGIPAPITSTTATT